MKYENLANQNEKVSFKEAVLKGLGSSKGLFVPEKIPVLNKAFYDGIESQNKAEIAFQILAPFVNNEIPTEELKKIVEETINFDIPLVNINERTQILELFHGPTLAFKDVGARFMARCLGYFSDKTKETNVLVATSGDTGSAVAQGFYGVEGVKVIIAFPKGKVSPFQEYQMTSLDNNIKTLEVEGSFDDCQTLVKQALADEELQKRLNLSTANSINVARFLPQIIYYFLAYKQLKPKLKNRKWVVSVPSGNFGNLTAGLYAKAMGLPIHQFVAGNNANDTFYHYLETGLYQPKASVETYANAMDVGAPSNFERIISLYNYEHHKIKLDIVGEVVSNQEIVKEIQQTWEKDNYALDPHAAVGKIAADRFNFKDAYVTVLGTASPTKFDSIMKKAIPNFSDAVTPTYNNHKEEIANSFDEYKRYLLDLKN